MSLPATRAGGLQWHRASSLSTAFRSSCFIWRGECTSRSRRSRRCVCSQAAAEPQTESHLATSRSATSKRRVALWVGYVGTPYKGLQMQRTTATEHTIEQELENAIFRAGGILESNYGHLEKVGWMRSSRTDKGVHSLATVISLKLELIPEFWGCNDDGIGFADRINHYLPETIKIFGIIPVNKSFDARRGCSNRTYCYLLPAETLGITEDTSEQNAQHCLSCFQSILSSFAGCHAFHNYTVRSQYRKRDVTFKDPLKQYIKEDDHQSRLSGSDSNSDEEESCNNDTSGFPGSSTSSFDKQPLDLPSLPKIVWLYEINEADRIFSTHFRRVFSITCGEVQNYNGCLFLELEVHGESFMLHQIRKMIGTAIAVMRNVLPSDVVPISLSCLSRVVLPIAPSEGLFLASNEFHPFRTCPLPKGSSGIKKLPKLEMSAKVLERKQKFWNDVLLPHMVDLLQDNRPRWNDWLEQLERGRICESEMQPVRKSWTEWRIQKQKQQAEKTFIKNHQDLDAAVSNTVRFKIHKTETRMVESKDNDSQSF